MTVESETKPAPTFAEIISNSWVFFNGEFVRYRDVRIGLMTHAFQYGTACFEGVRAYAGDDGQMYILCSSQARSCACRCLSRSTS
jgi:hypothetical protein